MPLTSSGRGAEAACLSSSSYLAMSAWSIWTSGGARAGAATNSRVWLLLESASVASLVCDHWTRTRRAFGRATRMAFQSCTIPCQLRVCYFKVLSWRTFDFAEISKYWRFSADSQHDCSLDSEMGGDSLFRWKVTFPVLTFRSYSPSASSTLPNPHSNQSETRTYLDVDLVTT